MDVEARMNSDTKSKVLGMVKNPFVIFSRSHIIQPSRVMYMVVYLHHWWIATAQGQPPRQATAPRIAPWIPSRPCVISLLPCTWLISTPRQWDPYSKSAQR